MNSRQRVTKTLNREPVDRFPIDLGSTYTTGIHLLAYRDLVKSLGLPVRNIRCDDVMQQLAVVDFDVLESLKCDLVQINSTTIIDDWYPAKLYGNAEFIYPGKLDFTEKDGEYHLTDRNGNRFFKPSNSYYFDSESGNAWYNTPFDPTPENFAELRRRTERLYKESDYAIFANFSSGFMESSPDFLMSLVLEPEEVGKKLNRNCDYYIDFYAKLYEAVGEYTCAVFLNSDMGTQNGPIISTEMFDSLIKPHFIKLCDWIHQNTRWKTLLHSCGGVEPLIEGFIEMGIDGLNPVQTSAAGMEPLKLKAKYGDRLVFWGGGCDTQNVLGKIHGDQLTKHVREQIAIFAPGGGFIFNPIHDIQPNVSGEDIKLIYETALAESAYFH